MEGSLILNQKLGRDKQFCLGNISLKKSKSKGLKPFPAQNRSFSFISSERRSCLAGGFGNNYKMRVANYFAHRR
tara:strand:- start:30 stop:251 length:222 start_codon:yes stop_codon:yes gene_type:complete